MKSVRMLLAGLRGRQAERRAARYLRRRGYSVLARNLRAGTGEIDILARTGDLLVVVEVRARAGGLLAADLSVTREKARRVVATWSAARRRLRVPRGVPVRFDLVLVAGRGAIAHLPGALLGSDPSPEG